MARAVVVLPVPGMSLKSMCGHCTNKSTQLNNRDHEKSWIFSFNSAIDEKTNINFELK